jgi:hypothetical protein
MQISGNDSNLNYIHEEFKSRLNIGNDKTSKVIPGFSYLSTTYEGIWRSGCIARPFSTSKLVGGEWSASSHCRLTPHPYPRNSPSTHSTACCVGPRADQEVMKNTLQGIDRSSSPQPGRYTDRVVSVL